MRFVENIESFDIDFGRHLVPKDRNRDNFGEFNLRREGYAKNGLSILICVFIVFACLRTLQELNAQRNCVGSRRCPPVTYTLNAIRNVSSFARYQTDLYIYANNISIDEKFINAPGIREDPGYSINHG